MRAIFYDTETTGIRTDKDRIIEIAAFDPLKNLTFEEFINPGCPIPAEATAIHKITNEMVASAPSFEEIGKRFAAFCEGDVVLIAHNNDSFDMPFIKTEFQRNNLPFLSCKFLDSLKWARRYRPDLPRHPLQFLREIYGIAANNAHRALDDVIVLHKVFNCMTGNLSIPQVFALMNETRTITSMPFGKHQGQPLSKIPRDYVSWLHKTGAFEKAENQALFTAFQQLGLVTT